MQITQKKTAVDLTDLAVGLVILGVVVSIGGAVLVNLRDAKLTELSTVQTANESSTFATTISDTLTNKWVKSVDVVVNQTNNYVINSGNYSVNVNAADGTGTISNTTGTFVNNWKVTYSWYNTSSRADYVVSNNSAVGLGEFGNWFKIIVIVGIAAVVLSLIFMAFGRGQNSSTTY